MKDYYKILGVSQSATPDEIKQAYYKLAHQHHPDKGGNEAKFKEINEAYQILSDRNKRAQYDQFGNVYEGQPGGQPGFDFNWAWGNNAQGFGVDFDFEDLGDIFGEFLGFGASRTKKDLRRGRDIEIDLEISLEETLKGVSKRISLSKLISCSRCKGSGAEPGSQIKECFSCRGAGQVQQIKRTVLGSFTRVATCPECGGEGRRPVKPCNVCKGEGRLASEEEADIFIPAGIDTNQTIKLEGKGEAGKRGGKTGNLFVRVRVKKHSVFERKGDDLRVVMPLTISQAALGDEIEVPTLDRRNILLNVPAGTENGKVLRVSGKGIPHFSGYGRGNLYVEFAVKTPKKLTRKQKDLLEQLKREGA